MNGNCCGGNCPSLEFSVLNGLDVKERCRIKNFGLTLHMKKGQTIFRQGAEVEGIFCIKEGNVKLGLESAQGDQITIKLLGGRGTIGHESIAGKSYVYTATCLSDTSVCFMSKAMLSQSFGPDSVISQNICRLSNKDAVLMSEIILSLRSKSVLQRVAESIIMLQDTFNKDERGFIDIDMTKEELANIVGSSVESVFRNLSDLKAKGYIAMKGKRIAVANEARLRTLGRIAPTK